CRRESAAQWVPACAGNAGIFVDIADVSERGLVYPWRDYSGRISPLKLAVFGLLFAPALWVALEAAQGWVPPNPFTPAVRESGLWTIRLIILALVVTPLRAIVQWPRLILVRRMIGVAAFAYALTHLSLYTASQSFDLVKVASEIVLR